MATSKMQAEANSLDGHKVVSQPDWMAAAGELLAEEKEFTRARDRLSTKRRALPWVKVETEYIFDTPKGKKTLAELFEGRSQLIVYHFMFGPKATEGCHGCSLVSDTLNGNAAHMQARDVAFTAVSRGPLDKIEAFKKRMGWSFSWVSSGNNGFNYDFRVSFTKEDAAKGNNYNYGTMSFGGEDAPGLSVFYKNAQGEVFRTYSTFGRGLEDFLGVYRMLDCVPKGRDEAGLPSTMAWVKHHDKYEAAKLVELK